jgi:hypothetical protein
MYTSEKVSKRKLITKSKNSNIFILNSVSNNIRLCVQDECREKAGKTEINLHDILSKPLKVNFTVLINIKHVH